MKNIITEILDSVYMPSLKWIGIDLFLMKTCLGNFHSLSEHNISEIMKVNHNYGIIYESTFNHHLDGGSR